VHNRDLAMSVERSEETMRWHIAPRP